MNCFEYNVTSPRKRFIPNCPTPTATHSVWRIKLYAERKLELMREDMSADDKHAAVTTTWSKQ